MPFTDPQKKLEYDRAYHARNREHANASRKKRWWANRDRELSSHKRWYDANREDQKDKKRQNYVENKDTIKVRARRSYLKHWQKNVVRACKQRAIVQNVPFDLSPDDLIVPELCPVFGKKLEFSNRGFSPWSPSVDRIIPKLGYVKGNIQVISYRANEIKRDASLEELEMLVEFLRKNNTRTSSSSRLDQLEPVHPFRSGESFPKRQWPKETLTSPLVNA